MFTGNSSCTHKCYTDDKATVEKETWQQYFRYGGKYGRYNDIPKGYKRIYKRL